MARGVRRRPPGAGKSAGPDRGPPELREGDEAAAAIDAARRATTSRRQLARAPHFEQISPEVGVLDEAALDLAMADDPDAALTLLADLTRATDTGLRELARRVAGRLVLDVARRGPARRRGSRRMASAPYDAAGGDLDVEASGEAIVEARAERIAVDPERLRVRRWVEPRTALCLLVDRSGSMGGRPLATSAVAAAAVAYRAPDDVSVVAFARDAVVIKAQDVATSIELVVDGVLALRGHGTTDVAGALRVAQLQLARSTAGRRVTVLLSDCRATEHGDVVAAAADLDELVIIAPDGDEAEAAALARAVGARCTTVGGPTDAAAAVSRALVERDER